MPAIPANACRLLARRLPRRLPLNLIWSGDAEAFLDRLPSSPRFDLIVSSPPYNIGKSYEKRTEMGQYLTWQTRVLSKVTALLKPGGSLCWQVGNFINKNEILPLDIVFHPILASLGLTLRNRIVWTFGHGLHAKRRFSGRYEVILWYTKGDNYTFNLDDVRIPAKYPGKRASSGPRKGQPSGNPRGKNPEDVWTFPQEDVWRNIPNVKAGHVEKTLHPCQFPIGLIERLVLALTPTGGLVFDPFAGVGSAGAAAVAHGRHFWGSEIDLTYATIATKRINAALKGDLAYRPHYKVLFDHTTARMGQIPPEWKVK